MSHKDQLPFRKRIRHHFETFGMRAAAWLIPRLPRRVNLWLARQIGALVFWLDRRGRHVALDNIRCAFGDKYTPRQRKHIARQSYQNLARSFMDLLWARNLIDPSRRSEVYEVNDLGGLRKLRETRGDQILLGLHHGDFEFGNLTTGFEKFYCMVPVQDIKNPKVGKIMQRLREISGHEVVRRDGVVLRMFRRLRDGRTVGLLGDLTVKPNQPGVIVEILGLKAFITNIPYELAIRTGASISMWFCYPREDFLQSRKYTLELAPPIFPKEGETMPELAQRIADIFTERITARPELWLWPYKHFRYLPPPAAEDEKERNRYPYYAGRSSRFDRLWKNQFPAEKKEAAPLTST